MNLSEYKSIENLNYFEYCDYLNNKYRDRSKSGLFKHHYYEYRKANLSNNEVAKQSTEEERNTIIYCNFLEHLFLHILIGEQTDSRLSLGLGGAINYIIPQINKYLDFGAMDYSPRYYENIDKDVFQLLCERCNQCVSKTQIALKHNNQLYLEVEQTLKDKGRALVVLGTGLGKTTTALQYLWNNKCKALVVGPNKLIKSGWEEYSDWVETITYQSFANRYLNIDYSKYGLVILDEAHHAGFDEKVGKGAEVWSKGIKYLLDNNVVKVLGLTATPNRSDNVDIGNVLFEDCVCEGYAVEDGIEKGLIYPFDYITALYNTEELVEEYRDCDNRELVGQLDLALQQSLTLKDIFYKYMPTDIKRKGIIFIQDIRDEQYVKDIMSDCYPNIEYRAIHSKMNKEDVNRNRAWFEHTDEGYLLAVNMISEGAHYKGVNTLIMFRKTSSYLVYTQQLGRIITLTKNENPNAIVFDLVNNIDSIEYSNRDNEDKRYQVSRIVRALEKSPLQKSKQVIIADESRDIVKAIRDIKDYKKSQVFITEWEKAIIIDNYPDLNKIQLLIDENYCKNYSIKLKTGEHYRSLNNIYGHCFRLGLLKARKRNLICIETQEIFESVTSARKKYKNLDHGTIKNIDAKNAQGYHFAFIDDEDKIKHLNNFIGKSPIPFRWDDELGSILKENYDKYTINELKEKFPQLTGKDIISRAKKLGLKKNSPNWTLDEMNILVDNCSALGAVNMCELLPNKKLGQIRLMAKKLNLDKYTGGYTWSDFEINKLKNLVSNKMSISDLKTYFPNISRHEILKQIAKLGLSDNIVKKFVWDEEKINFLIKNYNRLSMDEMLKKLNGCTKESIDRKALELGLRQKRDKKQVICIETGQIYESASFAIKETGFISIDTCCRGKCKTAGGYHWKYIEEGDENKD